MCVVAEAVQVYIYTSMKKKPQNCQDKILNANDECMGFYSDPPSVGFIFFRFCVKDLSSVIRGAYIALYTHRV